MRCWNSNIGMLFTATLNISWVHKIFIWKQRGQCSQGESADGESRSKQNGQSCKAECNGLVWVSFCAPTFNCSRKTQPQTMRNFLVRPGKQICSWSIIRFFRFRLTSNGLPGANGKGPFMSLSSVPQASPILWLRTTTCLPPSLKRGLIWKAMSLPLRKFTVNLWKTFLSLLRQCSYCVACTTEISSENTENWVLCAGQRGKAYILALGLTLPKMVIIILS